MPEDTQSDPDQLAPESRRNEHRARVDARIARVKEKRERAIDRVRMLDAQLALLEQPEAEPA